MPKKVQLRRGTTAQHATFIGAPGELTFDTDKTVLVAHDGATAGGFQMLRLDATGNYANDLGLATGKLLKVGGNPVVGPRKTGWAVPTGTATRTTFDTAAITTPQLAERLKGLIDDLTAHGLIGP